MKKILLNLSPLFTLGILSIFSQTSVLSQQSVNYSCTDNQISAMENAGLSQDKIYAACGVKNDYDWLSGDWRLFLTHKKTTSGYSNPFTQGFPELPEYWTISQINNDSFQLDITIETTPPTRYSYTFTPTVEGDELIITTERKTKSTEFYLTKVNDDLIHGRYVEKSYGINGFTENIVKEGAVDMRRSDEPVLQQFSF